MLIDIIIAVAAIVVVLVIVIASRRADFASAVAPRFPRRHPSYSRK